MAKQFLLAVLAAFAVACGSKPAHFAGDAQTDTGEPALHAIHDRQLRELMNRMDVLMHERFITETELDIERRKYATQIGNTATSLSDTVASIIGKLPSLSLQTSEQAVFLALANKLRQQAGELQQMARHNQIDAIDDHLRQINTTCSSCHALFRKLGN